jgi:hypothetical protein
LLAQKRTQKGQPITHRFTAVRLWRIPGVYTPSRGAAHKKLTPRKVVFLLFIPLLGCVKWQKTQKERDE